MRAIGFALRGLSRSYEPLDCIIGQNKGCSIITIWECIKPSVSSKLHEPLPYARLCKVLNDSRQLFKVDGSLTRHALALAAAMVYAEPQPMKWRSGQRSIYIFSKDMAFAVLISVIGKNVTPQFKFIPGITSSNLSTFSCILWICVYCAQINSRAAIFLYEAADYFRWNFRRIETRLSKIIFRSNYWSKKLSF